MPGESALRRTMLFRFPNRADMRGLTEASAELVDLDGGIYRYLLAGQVVRAEFPGPLAAGQACYAVRFLADAERLWRLNQDMHLEELAPPPAPALPRLGDGPSSARSSAS